MPDSIAIQPIPSFRARLRVPGSKSLTNRALLLAALAEGESVIRRPLWADDTRRMVEALEALGLTPRVIGDGAEVRVTGRGGDIPAPSAALNLGNAGTAYRFLTAALCLAPDRSAAYVLDGVPRMRQRPIGQLVQALAQLGARIDFLEQPGFPPLRVHGGGLRARGQAPAGAAAEPAALAMPPTLSSQYLSALLQVGPYCQGGLTLAFDGPVTSRPYVEMTLRLMQRFGVACRVDPAFTRIVVPPGRYRGLDLEIEPDASSASYFLAAAAILPDSSCTIEGLGRTSLQGDVGLADLLHQMGAGLLFGPDFITVLSPPPETRLRGIDVDLNAMPDMAPTLAVVALFADGPTTLRNIGNLRVKETDRLAALRAELTRLGAAVEIAGDDLRIQPPPGGRLVPAGIETYDDHRMAMSFAVAGLRSPGVVIHDPQCVGKTFPGFFEYLAGLRPAERNP